MLPGLANAISQRIIHRPNHSGGNTEDQRSGRDFHSLRQHGASPHHTTGPDPHRVQQHRAHPNETVVVDGASVQYDAVTHCDAVTHRAGNPLVDVDNAEILNVCLVADGDWRHVGSHDGVVPNARFAAQRHIPENNGSRGNESGGIYQGPFTAGGT